VKKPYAQLLYAREIIDHAHAIFDSISFIQVIQPVAGKSVTTEAVRDFTLPSSSQFLIRQATRVFGLPLSSPRQPGHGFSSLICAMQRRQFIPQGAISAVRIALDIVDLVRVTFVSCNGLSSDPFLGTETSSQTVKTALVSPA
jgi:hypothetical protein